MPNWTPGFSIRSLRTYRNTAQSAAMTKNRTINVRIETRDIGMGSLTGRVTRTLSTVAGGSLDGMVIASGEPSGDQSTEISEGQDRKDEGGRSDLDREAEDRESPAVYCKPYPE